MSGSKTRQEIMKKVKVKQEVCDMETANAFKDFKIPKLKNGKDKRSKTLFSDSMMTADSEEVRKKGSSLASGKDKVPTYDETYKKPNFVEQASKQSRKLEKLNEKRQAKKLDKIKEIKQERRVEKESPSPIVLTKVTSERAPAAPKRKTNKEGLLKRRQLFRDEFLDLHCEWRGCSVMESRMEDFMRHVATHVVEAEVVHNPPPLSDSFSCLWQVSFDWSTLLILSSHWSILLILSFHWSALWLRDHQLPGDGQAHQLPRLPLQSQVSRTEHARA